MPKQSQQLTLRPNLYIKVKKVTVPNQNFQGQTPLKRVKFDLFGFSQGQMATILPIYLLIHCI